MILEEEIQPIVCQKLQWEMTSGSLWHSLAREQRQTTDPPVHCSPACDAAQIHNARFIDCHKRVEHRRYQNRTAIMGLHLCLVTARVGFPARPLPGGLVHLTESTPQRTMLSRRPTKLLRQFA